MARPLIPPAKVLGVSRREGGLTGAGIGGVGGHPRTAQKSRKSLAASASAGSILVLPVPALAGTRQTRLTRVKLKRTNLSFSDINPSVGEPVCRVSDEGGFGRARPLGRAQPDSRVSGKTDRSRGWRAMQKTPKVIANKGRNGNSTPPHVGKGVGKGQISGLSSKKVLTFCKRHHQFSL